MTEIARITGVSQPTVSRVLSGNTSVNPEVAKKVLACAKEHNYHPNIIARSLNKSQTFLLAVIVPDLANPFFADLIKIIEREAAIRGYSILTFNSDYDQEKEKKYLGILQQYRVDGLLVAPVHTNEEGLKPFYQLTIPWMIFTNRAEAVNSVFVSHRKAGKMVAEHLISVHAEKFVFIGKKKDRKFLGFEEGLTEGGIDTRQNLTAFWESDKEMMLRLLIEFLHEIPNKAGIFVLNDMEALSVMNAMILAGISIPDKAALVGFDNTFISKRILPGMSSVNQPIDEMGRTAVERILEQIQGKEEDGIRHIELKANLVIRGSSRLTDSEK
ncbi:MAG: LacI family DNA-binding transcriptional regulator, partial [Lachnospiraceae bacterium]|nr:LacI family DNA-binding transcriptional regulator [Lachnospiraceae bacterium]